MYISESVNIISKHRANVREKNDLKERRKVVGWINTQLHMSNRRTLYDQRKK